MMRTALLLLYVPAVVAVMTSVVNRHVPLPALYRVAFNLLAVLSLFLWLVQFFNLTG
jgi:putative effector of murein hydrolase LrgA (UPF0299 family)